jgi:hypothetical protein
MIAYFGEVIKMSANISYLMMTLNRYLLVGKDHPPWLVSIAKLEFKWVIFGSLVASSLLNIGHGWEYQAVEATAVSISEDSANYYYVNEKSYSDYPQANQGTSYFYFSIVYFCINFGVFFILNTGLEVKIVRRMQKELKKKRERLSQMNAVKAVVSTCSVEGENQNGQQDTMTREEEDRKKEKKVIKMVVSNGILNCILRAPDMLFCFENANIFDILNPPLPDGSINKAVVPGILSLFADIGFLTFILTFSTNFIIFYKFNKKFKQAVVFFWTSKSIQNT